MSSSHRTGAANLQTPTYASSNVKARQPRIERPVLNRLKNSEPNPSDPIHWGRGEVIIYQHDNNYEVFLGKDFEVGPGPAYHVYLSTGSDIKTNDQFENASNFDIGKLKSFKSSQVYQVSSEVKLSQINSVVIWCETFGQLITSATLE